MIKTLAISCCMLVTIGMGLSALRAFPNDELKPEESKSSIIFQDRIMPIFNSPNPSSCVQCHLSSVDLKNYILPDYKKTFVSLRDQGLIDLENPGQSKILELIEMGNQDSDAGAKLIHEKLRKSEYEAFAAWIKESCKDESLKSMPPLEESELAKPPHPDEVIRHARKSRIVNSFVRNVWSQRMRCFPCHTPNEIGPRQKNARDKFDDWYDQFGDDMIIFKKTPEETIQYLVEQSEKTSSEYLPLLNLNEPEKSLLVLKPTSKVPPEINGKREPTYNEPVYHVGGLKMHNNDHSYKAFVAWIRDYANVTQGKYSDVDELPADNWFPTQRVLRFKEVPETWPAGTTMQLFVFAWNENDSWSPEPVAFTQGTITPRRIVNGPLFLLAPKDEEKFAQWKKNRNRLPPGRYLVKVFADEGDKLKKDPALLLATEDFVGQIEIDKANWAVGFKKAQWISGKNLSVEN